MPFADEQFWLSVRANIKTLAEVRDWWDIVNGNVTSVLDAQERDFVMTAAGLLPQAPWTEATWDAWLADIKPMTERSGKMLFMPLRKALTGLEHGPELKKLLPLLGRERVLQRLKGE